MSDYLGLPPWAAARLPASFRGIPFVILENSLRRGRQVALHVYPFRDNPWPEDMGQSPRLTSFRGFVIGDDVDEQIVALGLAVQQPGPGQLVHPTLGSFNATILEFTASDSATAGRMWAFEMSVVPYGPRIYPVITADTQAHTQGLFGATGAAIAADFAALKATVLQTKQAVTNVVQAAQSCAAQAEGLIRDATSLAHLPSALAGNLGRFNGANGISSGVAIPGVATIAQVSGTVNGAFARVARISGTLSSLASLI